MKLSRQITCHLSLVTGVFLICSVVSAEARHRVMIIMTQQSDPYQEMQKGFERYLDKPDIGVEYDIRHFDGPIQEAGGVLQPVKATNPSLLLTLGSPATEAVIREIKTIPIIAGMVLDEAEIRKGENATRIVLVVPLITPVQWTQRLLPNKKTVGILDNSQENTTTIEQARRIIEEGGLTLSVRTVEAPQDLPDALESLSGQAEILWNLTDSVVFSPDTTKGLVLFSFRNSIPFVGLSTSWVKAGAV